MFEDLDLNKEDVFGIGEDTYISLSNIEIFEGRFSRDRYSDEAYRRSQEYGKSLIGSKFSRNNKIYKIIDYGTMLGSVGYVGSLVLKCEVFGNKKYKIGE